MHLLLSAIWIRAWTMWPFFLLHILVKFIFRIWDWVQTVFRYTSKYYATFWWSDCNVPAKQTGAEDSEVVALGYTGTWMLHGLQLPWKAQLGPRAHRGMAWKMPEHMVWRKHLRVCPSSGLEEAREGSSEKQKHWHSADWPDQSDGAEGIQVLQSVKQRFSELLLWIWIAWTSSLVPWEHPEYVALCSNKNTGCISSKQSEGNK